MIDNRSAGTRDPAEPGIPDGLRVVADESLERYDRGRVLVGGSPTRMMRLSEHGTRVLDDLLAGVPVRAETPRSERLLARRLIDAAMLHPLPTSGFGPSLESVTAVIPVRDDPDGLAAALSALAAAVAVVIVDDASECSPATEAVAKRFGARMIRRSSNGGPAAARNTGLEAVETEFVAFIDADAVLDPQSLTRLLRNFHLPEVAACAPRVRSNDASKAAPCNHDADDFRSSDLIGAYESLCSPLDMGDEPSPVGPDCRVRYVPGAALVVRTEAAQRIGGFDETLRWGEDVDFVWRLVESGLSVRFDPEVIAWHRPRRSWRDWACQRRSYGASAASLAQRHSDKVSPARCTRSAAAFWVMAALGARLPAAAEVIFSARSLHARLAEMISTDRRLAVRLAASLTLRSHLAAGRGLASALTRSWAPLAVLAALACRRIRPALAMAVVTPALTDIIRRARRARNTKRASRLVVFAGIRVLDDLCYCIGVWEGMLRRRCLDPILARFVAVPAIPSGHDRPGRNRQEHRQAGGFRARRARPPRG